MTTAGEIMHAGATCIGERETLATAAQRMRELGVGALPICGDDSRLHGMITDRDIVVNCVAVKRDPATMTASELAQERTYHVDVSAGVRQMLRALKRGETVGLLPDQVPPDGMGVWVPFFGQPAYTMTLAARLVQQTGAAVGLLWTERLPGGQGYVVHAEALPGGVARRQRCRGVGPQLPRAGHGHQAAQAEDRVHLQRVMRAHLLLVPSCHAAAARGALERC